MNLSAPKTFSVDYKKIYFKTEISIYDHEIDHISTSIIASIIASISQKKKNKFYIGKC